MYSPSKSRTVFGDNAIFHYITYKEFSFILVLEFKESDIQVINGRYGPYIKHDGKNFKIPKGTDAATLTEERCKEIISSSEPSKKGFRRRKS